MDPVVQQRPVNPQVHGGRGGEGEEPQDGCIQAALRHPQGVGFEYGRLGGQQQAGRQQGVGDRTKSCACCVQGGQGRHAGVQVVTGGQGHHAGEAGGCIKGNTA